MAAKWNEAEFASIFREHYQQTLGIARRVVRSRSQAEEVCAEVFWRLYRAGPQPLSGGTVRGWLFRTASRAAIDVLRANKRRGEDQEFPSVDLEDRRDDALRRLLRREEIDEVRKVLARLDVSKAQLLLLRHSGLSYAEVASAMNVRPSSVGTMLARAEDEFYKMYARKALRDKSATPLRAAKEEQ
ncbi:MAG TPA: sigma-70 family RNA polymerase sigma factor [Bryocella sp.]|nr:sigma-70 family RNA polymerase sigma factor [Bryocella sp.]